MNKKIIGLTNPVECEDGVVRFGSVIGLKPSQEKYYRELHANAWPSVLARLKQSNIENYSIFITELEQKKYLFSYFEYSGTDMDKDFKAMADDPETQRWWLETDPCQRQLPNREEGANWSNMERVFFVK